MKTCRRRKHFYLKPLFQLIELVFQSLNRRKQIKTKKLITQSKTRLKGKTFGQSQPMSAC